MQQQGSTQQTPAEEFSYPPRDEYGIQLIEHMQDLSEHLHPGVIMVTAQNASRTITLVARSHPRHTSSQQLHLLSTTHAERTERALSLMDNPQDQLDLRLIAITISLPAILRQTLIAGVPTMAIAAVTQISLSAPGALHFLTPVLAGAAAALAWAAFRTIQWSHQGQTAAREIIRRMHTFRPTATPPPYSARSVTQGQDNVILVQTHPIQEGKSQPSHQD